MLKPVYGKLVFGSLQGKIIAVDSNATINWLKIGAIPTPCVVNWFAQLGLLKFPSNNSNSSVSSRGLFFNLKDSLLYYNSKNFGVSTGECKNKKKSFKFLSKRKNTRLFSIVSRRRKKV